MNVGLGLFVVVLLLCFCFGTPRMSNFKFPNPQFRPHTSNRKHQTPNFLSPAFTSKAPNFKFRISDSGMQMWSSQSPTWFYQTSNSNYLNFKFETKPVTLGQAVDHLVWDAGVDNVANGETPESIRYRNCFCDLQAAWGCRLFGSRYVSNHRRSFSTNH